MLRVLLSVMTASSAAGIVMKDANDTTGWQCLQPRGENENFLQVSESIFHCAKKNLYLGLVNNADSECLDVGDGVAFFRETSDSPSPRDGIPSEEPATLRGLMDAYSRFLSQRSLRWDLGYFYPGLVLRIGPTLSGSGVIEFLMDKRLDYHERAKLGPGQMIVRRTILPHLLGFRMNLSHVLPLLLGIIVFVTKNAIIFSKVTLGLSVLLTLKSLILLQFFRQQDHQQQHHPHNPVAHDPVDFMAIGKINERKDDMKTTGVVLVLLFSFARGDSVKEDDSDSVLVSLVWNCAKSEDFGRCLKLKASQFLDELSGTKEPLFITDYLSLVKDPKLSETDHRELNESVASAHSGKSGQGEEEYLDKAIWNKLVTLFSTRTVQLNLSSELFEGRGKEDKIFKKGHGFFLMSAMMGGMLMKMALAKIALVAGKALILGKIALVLSLIIALKKFTSQGGGGHPEVVYASSEHGSGRKLEADSLWGKDGGDLAYSAHRPESHNKI